MATNLETKISRIQTAVSDALAAVAKKGVTVPDGSGVDALAGLIAAIEAGGNNAMLYTLTPASDISIQNYVFTHNAGFVPDFIAVAIADKTSSATQYTVVSHVQYLKEPVNANYDTWFFITAMTTNSSLSSQGTINNGWCDHTNYGIGSFADESTVTLSARYSTAKMYAGDTYRCI